MIANMNVVFDKAAYEKGAAVKADVSNDITDGEAADGGQIVERAIRETIQSEKLGSLNVDPTFLHFRALECMPYQHNQCKNPNSHNGFPMFFIFSYADAPTSDEDSTASFFNLSEVRLYTVLGLIAALVLVALLQATCTIMKTRRSSRNQKVCVIMSH